VFRKGRGQERGRENILSGNILANEVQGRKKRGMARQVRIEYGGATYHLVCRGNRREAIYVDDDDRRRYLATLAEVVGNTRLGHFLGARFLRMLDSCGFAGDRMVPEPKM
jgi:hypothetical protein